MASDLPPLRVDPARPKISGSGQPRDEDAGSPRVISSDALLAGAAQLAILHNQTIYFLRQTRFGKLILTK